MPRTGWSARGWSSTPPCATRTAPSRPGAAGSSSTPAVRSKRSPTACGRRSPSRSIATMWERVAGQERAVGLLQQAAVRPVHSYLLAGPRGSGLEEGARCFAASLIAPDGHERAWDLVLRGRHPDVVEVDPPES